MTDNFGLEPQGPDVKRLLLAVVLTSTLLFVYNYFFAPSPVQQITVQKTSESASAVNTPPIVPSPNVDVHATPQDLPFVQHEVVAHVKNEMEGESKAAVRGGYKALISNVGAQIHSFMLDGYDVLVELSDVNIDGSFMFGLSSRDKDLSLKIDAKYAETAKTPHSVTYEHVSPEGVRVTRTYEFARASFMLKQHLKVTNESDRTRTIALTLSMAGGEPVQRKMWGLFGGGGETTGAYCSVASKRSYFTQPEVEKEARKIEGKVDSLGLDKRYFLSAVYQVDGNDSVGCHINHAKIMKNNVEHGAVKVSVDQQAVDLAPGAAKEYSFEAYMGPKQMALLKAQGHGLEDNIDFGFMAVLSRPLQWLLVQLFNFLGNFGIAIIVLTMLIKAVTFPLTQKSFVSMQQAKTLAPYLKTLQEKYAHDRAALAQKQMELYKEKGINPLAGCLPMLIQMPVWIALYQMLWNSVELYEQPFYLWIHDLTKPDPYFVLPLLMGASMVVQQAFQPTPQDQPQMKYVMWFMPVFLTLVMLNMPAGLNLYIIVNNVLTIFQQMYIRKMYPAQS